MYVLEQYPDLWPKGHKKKSKNYEERSKYSGVNLNDSLFWDYDYKQKSNLFGLDSIYRGMPKKSFVRGKKQELEATLMYCWLHGVERDDEYWCDILKLYWGYKSTSQKLQAMLMARHMRKTLNSASADLSVFQLVGRSPKPFESQVPCELRT